MAIDPKTLTIGAHINVSGERVMVWEITNTCLVAYIKPNGDWEACDPAEDWIEPIPITPELLTELGFECIARYSESWWQRGNKRIKMRGNYVDIEIYQGFYDATWRCKYLHELEAFLYLTTKTELIKE